MGGCRCVYKNCKKISDTVTHFFHFPVFDKQRCHTWIMNAHRPDLLNLTLSQLRNRVICQHHFAEDMFMNYMPGITAVTDLELPAASSRYRVFGGELRGAGVRTIASGRRAGTPSPPPRRASAGQSSRSMTTKKSLKHDAIPVKYKSSSVEKDQNSNNEIEALKETTIKKTVDDDSKFFTPKEKVATLTFPYNQFLRQCNYENIIDPSFKISLSSSKKTLCPPDPTKRIVPVDYNNKNTNKLSPLKIPEKRKVTIRRSTRNIKEREDITVLSESNNPPVILNNPPISKGTVKSTDTYLNTNENKAQGKKRKKVKVPNVIIVEEINNPLPVLLINNSEIKRQQNDENGINMPQSNNEVITDEIHNDIQHNVTNNCLTNNNPVACPCLSFELPTQNISQQDSINIKTSIQPNIQAIVGLPKKQLLKKRKMVSSKQRKSTPYIEKHKHSSRSPRRMSKLSMALLRKVNENSKDIAEIKNLLLNQNRVQSSPNKTSQKLVVQESERRKKLLFDEISLYISSSLKNDLYEELFLNI